MRGLKYVKLYEEFIKPEHGVLTDPVEIKKWIDYWKDTWVDVYISTVGGFKTQPRIKGKYTIGLDGSVDVDGDVYIHQMNLEYIPIQFGTVTGDFYCYGNNLKSLIGSPKLVGRDYNIYNNTSINTLKYCSDVVNGSVYCSNINIKTLEYLSSFIGGGLYGSDLDLVTDIHTSNIVGEIQLHVEGKNKGNQIEQFIEYLSKDSLDVKESIIWLQEADSKLFEEMLPELIKYSNDGNLNWFSDDVKDIASTALKGNHKLR